jgi:hypothetical protein
MRPTTRKQVAEQNYARWGFALMLHHKRSEGVFRIVFAEKMTVVVTVGEGATWADAFAAAEAVREQVERRAGATLLARKQAYCDAEVAAGREPDCQWQTVSVAELTAAGAVSFSS